MCYCDVLELPESGTSSDDNCAYADVVEVYINLLLSFYLLNVAGARFLIIFLQAYRLHPAGWRTPFSPGWGGLLVLENVFFISTIYNYI